MGLLPSRSGLGGYFFRSSIAALAFSVAMALLPALHAASASFTSVAASLSSADEEPGPPGYEEPARPGCAGPGCYGYEEPGRPGYAGPASDRAPECPGYAGPASDRGA
jgi:hypothetical protein